jgi:hypothetical protein
MHFGRQLKHQVSGLIIYSSFPAASYNPNFGTLNNYYNYYLISGFVVEGMLKVPNGYISNRYLVDPTFLSVFKSTVSK